MPGDLSHRFQDPRIGDAPGNELLLDHFQPGVIRIDHHRKDSLSTSLGAPAASVAARSGHPLLRHCNGSMSGVEFGRGGGIEPTTTRTPSECATGLRYAPNHIRLVRPGSTYVESPRTFSISWTSCFTRRTTSSVSREGRRSCMPAPVCHRRFNPSSVNPCSYRIRLIWRSVSMSFWVYFRCRPPVFWGRRNPNSDSQNRSTYAGRPVSRLTSPIL